MSLLDDFQRLIRSLFDYGLNFIAFVISLPDLRNGNI